jgi:Na+-translocating ferredoxin:NAD+ oxidoreductase RnfA subunit
MDKNLIKILENLVFLQTINFILIVIVISVLVIMLFNKKKSKKKSQTNKVKKLWKDQ